MPVSFDLNGLHLTFYRYLNNESYSGKHEKLPNIPGNYSCLLKYYKNGLVLKVWPANLAFRPIYVTRLHLRLECERPRVQFLALAKLNYVCCFCFVFVVRLFFVQKALFTYFVYHSFFAMLIHLVYLPYCKSCDRVKGYQGKDLASLNIIFKLLTREFVPPSISRFLGFKFGLSITCKKQISSRKEKHKVEEALTTTRKHFRRHLAEFGNT